MSVFIDGHVHLDSPTKLFAVLDELVGVDAARFRGAIASWPEQNPPGPANWSIEVSDWKGNTTTASIGDHLILTFGFLIAVSDADFQAETGS